MCHESSSVKISAPLNKRPWLVTRAFVWWRHLNTTTRMLWGKLLYSIFSLLWRIVHAWHKSTLQSCSEMHSGSCSQMTSSWKCPIEYTEFIKKMAGARRTWDWAPERGILGLVIFIHGFLPSKEEPGISFSQRETEDIVSLLITLSTLPPTDDAMLFSILICLDSMLPITHPRPLPRVRHFYEFGA